MVILNEEKKIIGIIKKAIVIVSVTIVFFPIVFTAQRIVPAVVSDPVYSEFEVWEHTVQKGERPDSELYIDIVAFFKIAGEKLLNIDAGNISLGAIVEPVYVLRDSTMVASGADGIEEPYDVSSGRIAIFMEYIKHWNLTGHEKMQIEFPDGSVPAHAHNTFLQVIHDHGLITGIPFVIFGILSFFISLWRSSVAKYEKEEDYFEILPVVVILAFAAASMVEWIFHYGNPFGFAMFIIVIPLLFKKEKVE